MRSNGLLKWLMLPMALLLVFVGIKLFSGDRGASPLPGDAGGQLTADEMRALGIEGDTPHDTVATLVAQVRQLRTELQTALSDNRNQRAENDRLRQRERSIEQRIQNVLDTERAQLRQDREQTASERQQAQGLLQDLQRQFEGLGGRAGHTDLPIGLGLEDGDGQHFGRDGVRWIEPDDARPAEGRSGNRGGFSFPNDFSPVGETLDAASETLGRATGGAVGLGEGFEQLCESVRVYARTGVVDLEGDEALVVEFPWRHAYRHLPLFGEFHGVADQVHQHLAQAHRVGPGLAGDARADVEGEAQVLFRRTHVDGG